MNTKLLDQYIEEKKIIELLEKLELQAFSFYDVKYERLFEILVYLLSEVAESDVNSLQQYLFKCIYKVKDDAFENEQSINRFIEILKSNSSSPYQNIASFIQRLILNIEDNIEDLKNIPNKENLKKSLLGLNEVFLKELIEQNANYEMILGVFYCCVKAMELPERRVILGERALNSFLNYIQKYPMGYLSHFIRPYYSMGPSKERAEYYLHVGEPFLGQIFEENGFESFLVTQDQDNKLVKDITAFYKELKKSKSLDKTIMIHSDDNEEAKNLGREYLKLQSDEHVWVRRGCRPPNYKE